MAMLGYGHWWRDASDGTCLTRQGFGRLKASDDVACRHALNADGSKPTRATTPTPSFLDEIAELYRRG
jgi:hypothetical protein